MLLAKLKVVVAVLLLIAAAGGGAALLTQQAGLAGPAGGSGKTQREAHVRGHTNGEANGEQPREVPLKDLLPDWPADAPLQLKPRVTKAAFERQRDRAMAQARACSTSARTGSCASRRRF